MAPAAPPVGESLGSGAVLAGLPAIVEPSADVRASGFRDEPWSETPSRPTPFDAVAGSAAEAADTGAVALAGEPDTDPTPGLVPRRRRRRGGRRGGRGRKGVGHSPAPPADTRELPAGTADETSLAGAEGVSAGANTTAGESPHDSMHRRRGGARRRRSRPRPVSTATGPADPPVES
jgi:hypothetical protein